MTEKEKEFEGLAEPELVKANLSPTANPSIFQDKETGELYYFDENHRTGWASANADYTYREPKLVKLNNTRE